MIMDRNSRDSFGKSTTHAEWVMRRERPASTMTVPSANASKERNDDRDKGRLADRFGGRGFGRDTEVDLDAGPD
jgi:hypothetical protein